LAIRLPDKPSSPSKVTLEHLGHSVIGKQNPHHEHRPLSSFDVEVHRHTVMVIEPLRSSPIASASVQLVRIIFTSRIARRYSTKLLLSPFEQTAIYLRWSQPTRERDRLPKIVLSRELLWLTSVGQGASVCAKTTRGLIVLLPLSVCRPGRTLTLLRPGHPVPARTI
jgi:hypothetical protein